jgi:hypothetical protein
MVRIQYRVRTPPQDVAIDAGLRAYMLRSKPHAFGLALTGATAWLTSLPTPFRDLFFQQAAGGFTLAPLGWIVPFLAVSVLLASIQQ